MMGFRSLVLPMAVAGLLSAGPIAFSQSPPVPQPAPPSQIANIWNGHDHQPTAGGVAAKERAAGIAPSPAQRNAESQALQQDDEALATMTGRATPALQ